MDALEEERSWLEQALQYRSLLLSDANLKTAYSERGCVIPHPWTMQGLLPALGRHPQALGQYLRQQRDIIALIKERISQERARRPGSLENDEQPNRLKKQLEEHRNMTNIKNVIESLLSNSLEQTQQDLMDNADPTTALLISQFPSVVLDIIQGNTSLRNLLNAVRQAQEEQIPRGLESSQVPTLPGAHTLLPSRKPWPGGDSATQSSAQAATRKDSHILPFHEKKSSWIQQLTCSSPLEQPIIVRMARPPSSLGDMDGTSSSSQSDSAPSQESQQFEGPAQPIQTSSSGSRSGETPVTSNAGNSHDRWNTPSTPTHTPALSTAASTGVPACRVQERLQFAQERTVDGVVQQARFSSPMSLPGMNSLSGRT